MTPSAYLESRGVTLEAAHRWGLILDDNRIFFPVADEAGVITGHAYYTPGAAVRWEMSDKDVRHRAVYGAPQALAKRANVVTVVESQVDAIRRSEEGECVVAAMSCLLTPEQAAIIARHWGRARVEFDADHMGVMGTAQAKLVLAAAGVTVEA